MPFTNDITGKKANSLSACHKLFIGQEHNEKTTRYPKKLGHVPPVDQPLGHAPFSARVKVALAK